jgi:hypothetical protein
MTDLEMKTMNAVVMSDYNYGSGTGGEDLIGNQVWAFSVVDGLNAAGVAAASHGGAVGSCVKKGWLQMGSHEKKDDVISMTREGFEAFKAAGGNVNDAEE